MFCFWQLKMRMDWSNFFSSGFIDSMGFFPRASFRGLDACVDWRMCRGKREYLMLDGGMSE
jgi:hypothetical protein